MKFGRKKKTANTAPQVLNKHYDVIRSPIITEKSTAASEQNKVLFEVRQCASKGDIKSAVEALFNVKVKSVNTLNRLGKQKLFRGQPGKKSDTKRAIITLEAGQNIDFASGAR